MGFFFIFISETLKSIMIKTALTSILLVTTIIYCVFEKNKANKILDENCIEVYLYKEFITPENNIELRQSEYYKENKNDELKSLDENYLNRLAFDTIEKKVVVKHGSFKDNINLIESTPFIKNDQIAFFRNLKNFYATLVLEKKIKIGDKKSFGGKFHLRQFVILVNKKPVLNGYLYCLIASSLCENTNVLMYEPAKFNNKLLLENFSNKKIKNINLKKDYPDLYQAFKNSNRLIE